MPNAYGRVVDKTYLSTDKAEERGIIHRDMIAHVLRWSHVVKELQIKQSYKTATVLDLGCGKEAPLIKTLYTSRMMPAMYCGVDLGKIEPSIDFSKYPNTVQFVPNTDIMTVEPTLFFNTIVMFEVLEHVEKDYGELILERVKCFMDKSTKLFLSTPCFNGSKANNHVAEWEFQELRDLLLKVGFSIENVWGTFASIKDYEHRLEEYPGLSTAFVDLREYYDTNVLACIFAPLFPENSRNCLWKLTI